MNKTIKGFSLHHGDGTSETHVIKGGIPRATFFKHEGDFEPTVNTNSMPLDEPHPVKPPVSSGIWHSSLQWACLLVAFLAFVVIAFAPR